MRASPGVVAVLCSALLAPVAALAVDVTNADTRPHRVQVLEWGEAHEFDLGPGVTLPDVCLVCTVKVTGGGASVAAEENDIVVIRDGVPQVGG